MYQTQHGEVITTFSPCVCNYTTLYTCITPTHTSSTQTHTTHTPHMHTTCTYTHLTHTARTPTSTHTLDIHTPLTPYYQRHKPQLLSHLTIRDTNHNSSHTQLAIVYRHTQSHQKQVVHTYMYTHTSDTNPYIHTHLKHNSHIA